MDRLGKVWKKVCFGLYPLKGNWQCFLRGHAAFPGPVFDPVRRNSKSFQNDRVISWWAKKRTPPASTYCYSVRWPIIRDSGHRLPPRRNCRSCGPGRSCLFFCSEHFSVTIYVFMSVCMRPNIAKKYGLAAKRLLIRVYEQNLNR